MNWRLLLYGLSSSHAFFIVDFLVLEVHTLYKNHVGLAIHLQNLPSRILMTASNHLDRIVLHYVPSLDRLLLWPVPEESLLEGAQELRR